MKNSKILSNNRAATPSKAEILSKIAELNDQTENGYVLTPFNAGLRQALAWAIGQEEEPNLEI